MMLLKATEKTNLPLAFETIIGAGTKKDQVYNVASNRIGYLSSFASAVNEKGKVTYGEVYLNLKGNKRTITIKNITFPRHRCMDTGSDHVSFSFTVSQQPR